MVDKKSLRALQAPVSSLQRELAMVSEDAELAELRGRRAELDEQLENPATTALGRIDTQDEIVRVQRAIVERQAWVTRREAPIREELSQAREALRSAATLYYREQAGPRFAEVTEELEAALDAVEAIEGLGKELGAEYGTGPLVDRRRQPLEELLVAAAVQAAVGPSGQGYVSPALFRQRRQAEKVSA